MKSWAKILVFVALLLPVIAQAEPLEQPCPSGQSWECDTYPGTEATCGCKKGGPRVYSVVPEPESLLQQLMRRIFEN